jgi:hypothetical protein
MSRWTKLLYLEIATCKLPLSLMELDLIETHSGMCGQGKGIVDGPKVRDPEGLCTYDALARVANPDKARVAFWRKDFTRLPLAEETLEVDHFSGLVDSTLADQTPALVLETSSFSKVTSDAACLVEFEEAGVTFTESQEGLQLLGFESLTFPTVSFAIPAQETPAARQKQGSLMIGLSE